MDILLDIVHSVDYGVLAYISEHWRGGLSDTVWKVFSPAGQLWCCLDYACRTAAVLPANTPRRRGDADRARRRFSAWQCVPQ